MSEHYVVEQTTPKWITTLLTSVGGVLAAALLIWIANSQLNISTSQAVLLRDYQAQKDLLETSLEQAEAERERQANLISQIWPRLRVHGENIQVLRRELETMCDCEIELKAPDKF